MTVQTTITGRTAKGEDYRNHYHFAFQLRGGQIALVKEYVDTLYATVNITQGLDFSFGKMKPKFTYEYTTDSAELPVLERSLLVEQIMPAKSTGFALNGQTGNWEFEFGVYSGDRSDGLSSFDDGLFYHGRATYDFNDPEIDDVLDREFWHFDYIYNADSDINTAVTGYRHGFATGVYLENGSFSLAADVMYATGERDVWGASIIPAIFFVGTLLEISPYSEPSSRGVDFSTISFETHTCIFWLVNPGLAKNSPIYLRAPTRTPVS